MKGLYHLMGCIILVFFINKVYTQSPVEHIWNEIDSIQRTTERTEQHLETSRWSRNMMLGTSYMFAPHFGSAMNMFFAPEATFSATNRLAFHGGLLVSHTLPLSSNIIGEEFNNQGFNSMSVYMSASYRLTESLTIHGTGVKSLAVFPYQSGNSIRNFQDLSVGASYSIGNFTIGASIHRSDYPYMTSPFGYGNHGYGSPLYW